MFLFALVMLHIALKDFRPGKPPFPLQSTVVRGNSGLFGQ
jgi:hypothetical protein